MWGKISEERQRECVVRRLCQVCHRPIRRGPGLSLVPLRPIELAGRVRMASNEPLTCRVCAPVSMKACPALRRLVSSGVVQVLEVADYIVAPQIIGPVHPPPDEPGQLINEALEAAGLAACIGLADLVPTRFRRLDDAWTDALGSSWAAVARSLGVEEAEARRFLTAERPGAAKWLCERAGEATPAQVAAQEAARSAEQLRAAALARVQRPYYDPAASDEEALADFGDLVPDLLSALRAAEKVPAMWGRAFALGLILLPAEAHVARFRLARLAAASEERHVALLDALEAWGYPRSLDVAIPELGSTTPLARLARAATAERQRVVREQIAREDHSEHGWGVSAAGLGGE